MYGNLKVLAGQAAFDEYAHHLREFGEPMLPYEGLLWIIRVVLVVALIAHAYAAFTLWSRANGARPQRYAVKKAVSSSLASRTMRWGGVTLLLFVIFHLIHFTIVKPNFNSSADAAAVKESPYVMVSASFSLIWVVLIYTLAMLALGMHIFHGAWSAQQTLGLTSSVAARARAKTIAAVLAGLIVVGFLIPPFYLFFTNL
jgi:succinate dehydrogenase / fumarate reductase cytochrome b subunit